MKDQPLDKLVIQGGFLSMSDVNCPYCGEGQEINHDDGHGYEEDKFHEQECPECEKTFVFTTSIHYYYSANKADCLNNGEHKYKQTRTCPKRYTTMRCVDCGHRRNLTDIEMAKLMEGENG